MINEFDYRIDHLDEASKYDTFGFLHMWSPLFLSAFVIIIWMCLSCWTTMINKKNEISKRQRFEYPIFAVSIHTWDWLYHIRLSNAWYKRVRTWKKKWLKWSFHTNMSPIEWYKRRRLRYTIYTFVLLTFAKNECEWECESVHVCLCACIMFYFTGLKLNINTALHIYLKVQSFLELKCLASFHQLNIHICYDQYITMIHFIIILSKAKDREEQLLRNVGWKKECEMQFFRIKLKHSFSLRFPIKRNTFKRMYQLKCMNVLQYACVRACMRVYTHKYTHTPHVKSRAHNTAYGNTSLLQACIQAPP